MDLDFLDFKIQELIKNFKKFHPIKIYNHCREMYKSRFKYDLDKLYEYIDELININNSDFYYCANLLSER